MIPGWTTATRFSRSISRIRSIAVKTMVSPPSMPAAPPDSPVPGPARDDRHAHLGRDPDELGDLRGRRREDDRARQPGVQVRRLVVAVALAVERVGQEPEAGEARGDRGDERIGRGGGPASGGSSRAESTRPRDGERATG